MYSAQYNVHIYLYMCIEFTKHLCPLLFTPASEGGKTDFFSLF